MLPGTAACMHFPEKTCPSLSVKGNAEALSRGLNFWQYRTVQLPAAAAQRINQGWRTGAEQAPQVPRGWMLSPWSCPQLTAHKLLRELCLLLMRSLLSALLCALSENTGHSFAPLVQLSGSEQEGAQLFSNCVCRSALIQVWCRMIFSSQMNLLQWQLSFSFPPPCLYLQSFHQEKQIHSRLPGQELGIRNKPPMET